jgi:hypothetical protein
VQTKTKSFLPSGTAGESIAFTSNPFLEVFSYRYSIFITGMMIVLLIYCVQTIASVRTCSFLIEMNDVFSILKLEPNPFPNVDIPSKSLQRNAVKAAYYLKLWAKFTKQSLNSRPKITAY